MEYVILHSYRVDKEMVFYQVKDTLDMLVGEL